MKEQNVQSANELHSVHQQSLSNDSEQHGRDLIEQEQAEDSNSEKEGSSDVLKKYLECLKSASGKRRRRCLSQELG